MYSETKPKLYYFLCNINILNHFPIVQEGMTATRPLAKISEKNIIKQIK